MIPQPHRLREEELLALARGGGGRTVRTLVAARRSRTLLLIRLIVGAARDDIHAQRAYQVLREVQQVAPDAFRRVVDHPSVGAWVTRTAKEVRRGSVTGAAELAWVALAAAVRGRVTTTVVLPPSPARAAIAVPSLGIAARASSGELAVRCGPGSTDLGAGVRIPAAWWMDGPGWWAARRVAVERDGVRASFLLNGWAPGELSPDLRVCHRPDVSVWQPRLAEGWDLLVRGHREVADELAAAVSVLTPLCELAGEVRSATLVDAFGCLFLSLPPDGESVAVTLAHELQHTKLNALMDLFGLIDPVPGERFYAPWRNDPRPLVGLLHGTYAYTGVSAFWRRQREFAPSAAARLRAHVEFAQWRSSTLEATQTMLASGRLTAIGKKFVAGMADTLECWCAEPVPKEALAIASRRLAEHRARWNANNRGDFA
jgi:HEXXH motif-containing protein